MQDSTGIIYRLTYKVIKKAEEEMPLLRSEIEDIIKSNDTNSSRIERTLDRLLDLCLWVPGKDDFERLRTYYSSIDPKSADAYSKFYKDEMELM